MAILILALIEIDVTDRLKILFICKENSGIFFSVQRRMAFARSFNMFPIILHVRLIN